ncbi:hypothetical protein [Iningainema tapete]|uniref:Uncharacterized protein n=1 Tax=Iningainema tapete BLCC-T55 TaxID=2748662 RepID=A0A8J6XR06_9CYAN|nr:hypothetical protein [Iningainema tapete]MBD2774967.1 hypothetical protein [Iningainema tapete BLCC-T55]
MFRPVFTIFAQQYLKALLSDYGNVYLNEPIPRDPKLRIFKHPSRFNWGTEYLSKITAGSERVMISPEVIAEAELVDVLFEPEEEKSRTSLGLLGELVSIPCIIETLRWTPNQRNLRTCLGHWLTWTVEADGGIIPVDENPVYTEEENDQLDDDEENDQLDDDEENDQLDDVNKKLLIITPSITPERLQGFGARKTDLNIPGVYELAPAFYTTIVVTSELQQDASTLWLRILGRGSTQRTAIMELQELDVEHPHRAVVRQQLQQWYQLLSHGQMGKESKRLMQTLATC